MTLYGWIGGSLAVLYNIPQIYHVYRVKRVEGVSSSSLLLRIVSYGLVIYHSFLLEDPAILYTTSASCTPSCGYTEARKKPSCWISKVHFCTGQPKDRGDIVEKTLCSPRKYM